MLVNRLFNRTMITQLLMTLALLVPATAREWRGIVPLHSTRADVERLLGPPQPGTVSGYRTETERVSIMYADYSLRTQLRGVECSGRHCHQHFRLSGY